MNKLGIKTFNTQSNEVLMAEYQVAALNAQANLPGFPINHSACPRAGHLGSPLPLSLGSYMTWASCFPSQAWIPHILSGLLPLSIFSLLPRDLGDSYSSTVVSRHLQRADLQLELSHPRFQLFLKKP